MKINFSDLQQQNAFIKKEFLEEFEELFSGANFIKGNYVDVFCNNFAEYTDAEHVLGVGNGTDAIEICLEVLDLPKNSKVLVPVNTFVGSIEPIIRSGLEPIFVDVDSNLRLCLNDLRAKVCPQTSAVLLVHLYGDTVNLDEVLSFAKDNDLKVIEDCAQAHGSRFNDRHVGTFGDVGAFSFYPGKNLGAFGDAGAIITNNEDLYLKAKLLSDHGRFNKYDHLVVGRNSRLDGIQAMVLSLKLKYLDYFISKRRKNASYYRHMLDEVDIYIPKPHSETHHSYHQFVIITEQRDELQKYLAMYGIETGLHYPQILSSMAPYLKYSKNDTPLASRNEARILSLPISEHLEEKDIEYVSNKVRDFYGR